LRRDIFSRVVYGISLPASLFVVVVSLSVGGALGAIAGFWEVSSTT
jgi:ABC-type dipeptide/oligopeptide/nickel transport system permease subunit